MTHYSFPRRVLGPLLISTLPLLMTGWSVQASDLETTPDPLSIEPSGAVDPLVETPAATDAPSPESVAAPAEDPFAQPADEMVFSILSFADMARLLFLDPTQADSAVNYEGLRRIRVDNQMPALPATPIIEEQPVSKVISQGDHLVLSTTVSSSLPENYQWRKNGQELTGARQSELIITNATPADSGWYLVTAANINGFVVTDAVLVTVLPGVANEIDPPGGSIPTGTGTALLTWAPPIERTDGTPLPTDEISGYRVYQGNQSLGWYRDHFVTRDQTTFWLDNLTADLHYFSVTAVDRFGQESAPTTIGYKRISNPIEQGG